MNPEQSKRSCNDSSQPNRRLRNRFFQHQKPPQTTTTTTTAANCYHLNLNYLKIALICLMCHLIYSISQVSCQLPDDIQRELQQNLAEQARLQAMRARHQQQIQTRTGGQAKSSPAGQSAAAKPAHDPNNYSFQQVSPPVQYSYYQPYGDLANNQPAQQTTPLGSGSAAPATPATASGQAAQPLNFDLNNLNIDLPNLPQPQAQTAPARSSGAATGVQMTPHFTGAGGLPVLQPVAAAQQAPGTQVAAAGQPQQGPPLTEADFKDITGGENYGAPNDFNQNTNDQAGQQSAGNGAADQSDDARLREFGMSDDQAADGQRARAQPRQDPNPMAGMMSGLGDFNPMGNQMAARPRQSAASSGGGGGFDPFGGFGGGSGGGGDFNPMGNEFGGAFGAPSGGGRHRSNNQRQSQPGGDFDFASQPSSSRPEQQGDAAQGAMNGGAPGSLQSLLGNAFPGLAGGQTGSMGLDGLARGNNAPESQLEGGGGGGGGGQQPRQRTDDGALDIADLGDKADSFSGADLGGFEQPSPQNDQDFNYAAAAEHQPKTVPYPDGGPQFVGSLWALGQPQSLSQVRYNPLPDKGTYQDYPAYQSGGNDFGAVSRVVDETPRARRPAPGRYSQPSPAALAPEHRNELAPGGQFDYAHGPRRAEANYESSSLSREFGGDGDDDDFVD